MANTIKARTSNNSDVAAKGPKTARGGQEKPSIEIFGKYGGKTARSISAKRDFRTMSKIIYVPDDKNGASLAQQYNERGRNKNTTQTADEKTSISFVHKTKSPQEPPRISEAMAQFMMHDLDSITEVQEKPQGPKKKKNRNDGYADFKLKGPYLNQVIPFKTTSEAIGKNDGGLAHYLALHQQYEKQRVENRISTLNKEIKVKRNRQELTQSEMKDSFVSLDYKQAFGPGGLAKYKESRDRNNKLGRQVNYKHLRQTCQGADSGPLIPNDYAEDKSVGVPRLPRHQSKMVQALRERTAAGGQEIPPETMTDNNLKVYKSVKVAEPQYRVQPK